MLRMRIDPARRINVVFLINCQATTPCPQDPHRYQYISRTGLCCWMLHFISWWLCVISESPAPLLACFIMYTPPAWRRRFSLLVFAFMVNFIFPLSVVTRHFRLCIPFPRSHRDGEGYLLHACRILRWLHGVVETRQGIGPMISQRRFEFRRIQTTSRRVFWPVNQLWATTIDLPGSL